jgi:hypothetical protein
MKYHLAFIAFIAATASAVASVYLGTQKIGAVYLGDQKIAKRYLGDQLIFDHAGTPESVLLTPAMTSNTTPAPYVCSAVSIAASGHPAFGAFDQVANGGSTSWGWISAGGFNSSTGVGSAWVQIYFGGDTRTLKEVVIRSRCLSSSALETGRSPRDFQLIALDSTGAEAGVLTTVTDSLKCSGVDYEILYTGEFDAVIGGIKMLITKNWTGDTRVAVGEIELYGY